MSPLEIQILLHYYACADDFRDGDFSAPAVRGAIDRFLANDYLRYVSPIHKRCYELTNKGYVYVTALLEVPEPASHWVVNYPTKSPA
jgi:hypothetical protein